MTHTPISSARRFLRYGIQALFIALPAGAGAGTIHVPMDQATIQAGIDVAAAGDTVMLAAGTYSGPGNRNLDFGGVDLVLTSESGAAVTIIDGAFDTDGPANGFIFQGGETRDAVVQNITIRDCWAPADPTYGNSGGGMLIIGASPTLIGVRFQENGANGGSGGGIACVNGAWPMVESCEFTGNYTNNYGSAIYCTQGASPTVNNCIVDGNTGNGAIGVANSDPSIQATFIRGNQGVDARGGGGLRFSGTADVNVHQCVITGNKPNDVARGGGGVLLLDTAVAYLGKCTIAGNTSADVGGGILLASGSDADVTIQESLVWGNCAANDGDEIYLDSGTGSIGVYCSDIDSAGVAAAGITYDVNTIFDDPLFCDPLDCTSVPSTGGEFTVDALSPVLAANNACGLLMGWLGMGCSATATERTTWGSLKTRFRDR